MEDNDTRLSWNELADEYDKRHGGRAARTLQMETVFDWAASKESLFTVDEEGYIHRVEKEE